MNFVISYCITHTIGNKHKILVYFVAHHKIHSLTANKVI